MHKVKDLWRSAFDVRKGERLRTLFMFLYLFFVLFVHYILKTISRAMFVTKFGSDELPNLYILIALAGGVLAAVYTSLALRTSLDAAVGWMMGLSVLSLLGFWQLLPYESKWLLYGFNIWAQLFGVIIVA